MKKLNFILNNMIHLIYINLIINAWITGFSSEEITRADKRWMRVVTSIFGFLLGFEYVLVQSIIEWIKQLKGFFIRITQITFFFKFKKGEFDNLSLYVLNNIAFNYHVIKNDGNWTWNNYLKCAEKIFKHNNYDPKNQI